MTKNKQRTQEERIAIVRAFPDWVSAGNSNSYRAYAEHLGVPLTTMYSWTRQYGQNGDKPAAPVPEQRKERTRTRSDAEKLAILRAMPAWLEEHNGSMTDYAESLGIDRQLLYRWNRHLTAELKADPGGMNTRSLEPAVNGSLAHLEIPLPRLRLVCPKCGVDMIEHSERQTEMLKQAAKRLANLK